MAKGKSQGARRGAGQGGNRPPSQPTIEVEAAAPKKPRTSPGVFLGQVRAEGRKITWPTYKETWITSVMVLIMVVLASIFFWGVDFVLGAAFQRIIAFGQ